MQNKLSELMESINEAIRLFQKYSDTHWTSLLAKYLERLKNKDFKGITELLGLYGRMGSINDTSIPNEKDNDKLVKLLSKIHVLAKYIQDNKDLFPQYDEYLDE